MKKFIYFIVIFLLISTFNKCFGQFVIEVNKSVVGINLNYSITVRTNSGSHYIGNSDFYFTYNTTNLTNHQFTDGIGTADISGDSRLVVNILGIGINSSRLISTTPVTIVSGSFDITGNTSSATDNFACSSSGSSASQVTTPPSSGTESAATYSCNAGALIPLGPLPITLSTFSATKEGERSTRLNWATSSEINSEYFGIERSSDGEYWETIGKVAAAGNSNETLEYKYIDNRLPFTRSKDQIFYYRLRLTDLDGSYKYSDIKGVNFSRQHHDVISIYPNPTTDRINVDVSGIDATAGDIQLSVFDNTGRNMLHKKIIGNGIELIETVNYASGTYNVLVKQGEIIHQKKVIKLD